MEGEADGYHEDAKVFNELRATLAARLLAANKPEEAVDIELQLAELAKRLPSSYESPVTVTEADNIACNLTGGAMRVEEVDGRMMLRGADAGSGVRLPRCLTTRAGIAAAIMEYYR